jgi:predicted component of type VI protein secretion system
MLVKLRVLGGNYAGKEIKIPLAKFFIGRGEDCHLRPQSDLISRHHAAIIVEGGTAIIRDLKSRNGTVVNGEKITGDVALKTGDVIKVGPLEFEVFVDHGQPGPKQPKVADVKDAAVRVAEKATTPPKIEDDITSWLEEADEEERTKRIHSPQTRLYRVDEIGKAPIPEEGAEDAAAPTHDTAKQAATSDTKAQDAKKPVKKEPGKLPPISKETASTSRDAAAEMLKKFFNRR